jgi:hypothetical protein
MFSFRAANRNYSAPKRPRRGSLHARKLRVEQMESRTMLSGTSVLAPFDFSVSQFAVYNAQFFQLNAPAKYTVAVIAPVQDVPHEGGFINVGATLNRDVAGRTSYLTSDYLTLRAEVLAARQLSPAGINELAATNYFADLNNFADWAVTASAGLQPVTFGAYDSTTEFGPTAPTFVINPSENKVGQNEGGAIPLHPIVAGIREELAFASRDSLASSSARLNSQSSARLVAASERAISGEWARAAIFEFAGDDSDSHNSSWSIDEPNPAAAAQSTPKDDDTLFSADIEQAKVTPKPAEAPAQQPGTHSAAVDQATVPAAVVNMTAAQKGAVVLAVATSANDAAKAIGEVADGTILASDAAFDQLGQDGAAYVESSSDRSIWSRTRAAATPILMVLALERIAAINSRRATKERPSEFVQRPRLRRR